MAQRSFKPVFVPSIITVLHAHRRSDKFKFIRRTILGRTSLSNSDGRTKENRCYENIETRRTKANASYGYRRVSYLF